MTDVKHEFINKIGFIVKKVNDELGRHYLNSIPIAQACLESNYGKSDLMTAHNAVFGIKATKNWTGAVYNSITGEYYNGVEHKESAGFRAYDTLEDCVKDYFNIISLPYYTRMKDNYNYKDAVIGLKPYATDPVYIYKILNIIEQQRLYSWDTNYVTTKTDGEDFELGDKVCIKINDGNMVVNDIHQRPVSFNSNIFVIKGSGSHCWYLESLSEPLSLWVAEDKVVKIE